MRLIVLAMTLALFSATLVSAQAKGSRCVVKDKGWCWASPPGKPGDRCECPNPNGSGTLSGKLR